jgi:hypothetical protein
MTNLITRVNFEVRHALHHQKTMNQIFGDPAATRSDSTKRRIREAAAELVDYMLFIEEAPLTEPVRGSSGFAELFAKKGPLREFDLDKRLFKVPCSYMIYSAAFDGMGPEALEAVYRRLYEVLQGRGGEPRYDKLTAADRREILKTLQKTKKGLPDYLMMAQ